MHDQSHNLPKKVALTSITIDIILFAIKLWIGLLVGSLALISDSFHTLSDSLSSGAVYIGLKISEKPPDDRHPYGHGRADQVALLVVGILLIVVAVTFLTEGAMALLTEVSPISMDKIFFVIIIITAVVKEVMGEISYYVGKKNAKDSLKADAWHHRSDALTTVLVLAAIYGSQVGFPHLDPIMGIIIAIILGYIGMAYSRKAVNKLLGMAPSETLLNEIKRSSEYMAGVKSVHKIRVHEYGDRMAISLHMEPEPGSLKEGHRIVHRLTDKLEEKYPASVDVHLDPWEIPVKEIKETVKSILNKRKDAKEPHHITISEGQENILISFHLVLPRQKDVAKAHETVSKIEREVERELKKILGFSASVQIHVEPCEEECELCELEG